ncbi:unnamed protein product [Ostreobium quekettii]|uniref:GCF C-terminal domain-containing protein n=1 Tax=Ostreobium quekettii TaxID=121088 RepID=A0A8S1J601_9CHLO|nr:unnamed protein product [Ostreobium quekettii]
MTSQAQGVLKALRDDLVRLQDAQHQAERNLGRTSDTVQSTLQEVDSLKSELAAVGVKYADMQELKAYVADLCDCLKSKAAYVEELEDHMKSLMEERANSAAEMRESTNEEDYKIADASVSSALDVLSRGGSHAAAAKAAEDAASAVEEKLQGVGSTPELDEFGRNINLMHQAAAKGRAEARKARWEKERQKAKDLDFSSEDVNSASESEAKRFDSRCEEVLQAAASVFADAAPEFGSLPSVCRRLGEWKARYPKAYRDAYLSTSLPALIAPFARLDLLRWHPIFGHDVGFDSQQWYTELDMYGQSQPVNPVDSTEQAAGLVAEDPDGDLVPQLVLVP